MGYSDRRKLNGSPAPDGNSGGEGLDEGAQRVIGARLKAMYDEVVNEPVPDRLTRLIGELDAATEPAGPQDRKDDT